MEKVKGELPRLAAPDACTACGACVNACKRGCLALKADAFGFAHPVVDAQACVRCGLCERVCPIEHPLKAKPTENPQVVACWSKNEDTRYHSTSGGAFTELALSVLGEGGVVCGARYNDRFLVEHCLIEKAEDLPLIRQSKYVQSEMGDCFSQIKRVLDGGRKVAFCGCPCQVAGLLSFLGGRRENLLLIDFICRGSNSPKALEAFLEMLKARYGAPVKRVWFKNKEKGWNCFSTRVDFENGETYLEDRYHDPFIQGYIHYNLYMRPCCYECRYKDRESIVADITLGDFWGVGARYPHMDTDGGTSMLILNTEKGEEAFAKIGKALVYEVGDMQTAQHGNPCLQKSAKKNPRRAWFLSHLDTLGFEACYRRCTRPTLKQRLKNGYYALGHFVKNTALFLTGKGKRK